MRVSCAQNRKTYAFKLELERLQKKLERLQKKFVRLQIGNTFPVAKMTTICYLLLVELS